MRIQVFGPAWDAPMYEDAIRDGAVAEPPIGTPCHFCEEPIAEGDGGIIMGAWDVSGKVTRVPVHKECELRSVIGSVGHMKRKCRCFVTDKRLPAEDDPPGMTKRQAALAAWEFFHSPEWLRINRGDLTRK